jgi:plasmid stabilization system protein ParE
VRVEPHAVVLAEDLPAIYAFIARDNPGAAESVLDAIDATFEQLVRQPECGVIYPTRHPRLRDVRMLPVHSYPNYLIFYRLELDAIRILYVVHGARHLPRLFRREPRR